MIYHCERCGVVLRPGERECRECGKRFSDPVPPDAEAVDASVAGLLSGRTAGQNRGPATGAAPGISSRPSGQPAGSRRVPIIVGVCLAVVAVLALAGWGGMALWMQGPGGEIAFQQHNMAGNRAFGQGDYRTADDEYGQMIALRPRRPDGYLLRGMAESRQGLNAASAADDTAAMAWTHDPIELSDLYFNRGQALINQRNLAGAVADFTQSLLLCRQVTDPAETPYVPGRQRDTYGQRAEAFFQLKQYARAVADCSTIITSLHPRPENYGLRAKAEAAMSRDAAARTDFQKALRLNPVYADGYAGLGQLADKDHQYAQGVAAYQQATRLLPDEAWVWGSLGWFQYEAGQYPQSVASSRRSLSQEAGQGWVAYNLGLCYAAQGDSARARATYAAVLGHSQEADREAGLKDIANALARQPGSTALHAAQQQLLGTRAVLGPVPHWAAPPGAQPSPPGVAVAGLGPEVTVGSYALRPPAGYTLTQDPYRGANGDGTTYLWSGPARADGTVPTLEVVITDDGGNLALDYTPAQLAQQYLTAMENNHRNLVLSPVQACAVGGLPFGRGDWKGIGQRTGKEYAGTVYMTADTAGVIQLAGHDATPYSRTTLPLIRASIMTFRKR